MSKSHHNGTPPNETPAGFNNISSVSPKANRAQLFANVRAAEFKLEDSKKDYQHLLQKREDIKAERKGIAKDILDQQKQTHTEKAPAKKGLFSIFSR